MKQNDHEIDTKTIMKGQEKKKNVVILCYHTSKSSSLLEQKKACKKAYASYWDLGGTGLWRYLEHNPQHPLTCWTNDAMRGREKLGDMKFRSGR